MTALSHCTLGIFSITEQSGNIEKGEDNILFPSCTPVPVNTATDCFINNLFHSMGGTGYKYLIDFVKELCLVCQKTYRGCLYALEVLYNTLFKKCLQTPPTFIDSLIKSPFSSKYFAKQPRPNGLI